MSAIFSLPWEREHFCKPYFIIKETNCKNVPNGLNPVSLSLSCLSLSYQGYEERVFEAEWSSDGEHRAEAAQQSSKQDEFANVRLHRQTSQVEAQRSQVLWAVQCVLALSQKRKENARLVIFNSKQATLVCRREKLRLWKTLRSRSLVRSEYCWSVLLIFNAF